MKSLYLYLNNKDTPKNFHIYIYRNQKEKNEHISYIIFLYSQDLINSIIGRCQKLIRIFSKNISIFKVLLHKIFQDIEKTFTP